MERFYQATADLVANEDLTLPWCAGKKTWTKGEGMGIAVAHAGTRSAAIRRLKKEGCQNLENVRVEKIS